ncbi:Fused isobutyryl-CoA mutase [subsurface metagenome]
MRPRVWAVPNREDLIDEMKGYENTILMSDIEGRGGLAKCTEDGYVDRLLSMQAYQYMKEIENKERIVVGVNEFIEEDEEQEEVFRVSAETEEVQIKNLRRLREERSNQQVQKCLADLRRAAEKGENVMPYCVEAAKVYATEGEMMRILKDVYGEYSAPAVF